MVAGGCLQVRKLEGKKPKGYRGPTHYVLTGSGSFHYLYVQGPKIAKKQPVKHRHKYAMKVRRVGPVNPGDMFGFFL